MSWKPRKIKQGVSDISNKFRKKYTGRYTVSTERKYTLAAKPSTQNQGGLEEK